MRKNQSHLFFFFATWRRSIVRLKIEDVPPKNWLSAWPAVPPVARVGLSKHVPARHLGLELGADQEGAAHLAMQRVRLLGRRREAFVKHHRDEAVDPLRGALSAEVERPRRREGLAQDHHGVHVGVLHRLPEETSSTIGSGVFFFLPFSFFFFCKLPWIQIRWGTSCLWSAAGPPLDFDVQLRW